jgi:hypothetical protein
MNLANRNIEVMEYNTVNISARELRAVDVEATIRTISELATSGRLSFPYKRSWMGDPQVLFKNIMNSKLTAEHKPYTVPGIFPCTIEGTNYCTVLYTNKEYEQADILSDFFQEVPRMRANVRGFKSPLEVWGQNSDPIIRHCVKTYGEITTRSLRESVYALTKECTQFKSTLTKLIIEYTKGARILDFSAGWGDRLIGALACKQVTHYTGFDPNVDLRPGYEEIIKTLNKNNVKCNLQFIPIQDAKFGKYKPDLILCAPPYFNYEEYSKQPRQSYADFSTFDAWLINFLFTQLARCWAILAQNGHIALYIMDVKGCTFTYITLLFVQARLPGATLVGPIAFRGVSGHRRIIWIFRKGKTTTPLAKEAELEGAKKYAKIWHRLPSG